MDPEWFYSSTAQATAALVGFAGAFLLLRLQDYMAHWRSRARELASAQSAWASADLIVEAQERTWRKAAKGRQTRPPREQYVSRADERVCDEAWRRLRPLLDEQDSDKFPMELWVATALVGLLYTLGCVVPLLLLGSPNNSQQLLVVGLVSALVVVFGLFMLCRARVAFREWLKTPLYDRTELRFELQRIDEAEFEKRMEAEEAARKRRDSAT
ncbi:MAG TPA: hypothetical protein VNB24_09030 [Acidimicrobiales bacterium]|nr:hypothetical protein [Acidimicrobiales bacterium]